MLSLWVCWTTALSSLEAPTSVNTALAIQILRLSAVLCLWRHPQPSGGPLGLDLPLLTIRFSQLRKDRQLRMWVLWWLSPLFSLFAPPPAKPGWRAQYVAAHQRHAEDQNHHHTHLRAPDERYVHHPHLSFKEAAYPSISDSFTHTPQQHCTDSSLTTHKHTPLQALHSHSAYLTCSLHTALGVCFCVSPV